jgi:TRAP-type C4-dicarboxylate transport system permease small subunit
MELLIGLILLAIVFIVNSSADRNLDRTVRRAQDEGWYVAPVQAQHAALGCTGWMIWIGFALGFLALLGGAAGG